MSFTRRRFLETTAFALGALRAVVGATAARRVVGFSTPGCPGREWNKILTFAQAHEFSAIELHGLQGNVDFSRGRSFSRTTSSSQNEMFPRTI